jgi:hypothetical protein
MGTFSPPNVLKYGTSEPNPVMCERLATTPPMGMPLPIGLPMVAMSASMF